MSLLVPPADIATIDPDGKRTMEGAIDAFRNGVFTKVVFVNPPVNGTEADVSHIISRPPNPNNNPPVHGDSGVEELINSVIETLSYAPICQ
jgi:hypothetical protein